MVLWVLIPCGDVVGYPITTQCCNTEDNDLICHCENLGLT